MPFLTGPEGVLSAVLDWHVMPVTDIQRYVRTACSQPHTTRKFSRTGLLRGIPPAEALQKTNETTSVHNLQILISCRDQLLHGCSHLSWIGTFDQEPQLGLGAGIAHQ